MENNLHEKKWDVFISHASEDKEEFVNSLAESLKKSGFKVWYDDFVIKVGDRISEKINSGLVESAYGIVVLSHNFFKRDYPKNELAAIFVQEVSGKKGHLIPIWHNITHAEIIKYYPLIADYKAIRSKNMVKIIEEIENVVRPTNVMPANGSSNEPIHIDSLLNFMKTIFYETLNKGLSPDFGTPSGVKLIVSELYKYGISTLYELKNIIPKELERKIGNYLTKTNFLGLLRLILIINDIDKYFNYVLDAKAMQFSVYDIKVLLAYSVNVKDYFDTERIYIIDEKGNFIDKLEEIL